MKGSTQRTLRQFHNWLGIFFAPAIFFFAFSGMLQTIGLQDKRGDYTPPAWIAALANVHKNQVVTLPRRPDRPPTPKVAAPAGGMHDEHDHDGPGFSLFKPFVLLLSAALMLTTVLGVLVALANRNTRRTTWTLLAAGVVVPVALLLA